MTQIAVLPQVKELIDQELSLGGYSSESDVVLEAMRTLVERRKAIEGIREGLADVEAGRFRPWREFEAEFTVQHQIDSSSTDDP